MARPRVPLYGLTPVSTLALLPLRSGNGDAWPRGERSDQGSERHRAAAGREGRCGRRGLPLQEYRVPCVSSRRVRRGRLPGAHPLWRALPMDSISL